MDRVEIMRKIEELLKKELNVITSINDKTALLQDNILDSLDFMNYVTMVESSFSISISNEDISDFKLGVVGNMVTYIEQRIKKC